MEKAGTRRKRKNAIELEVPVYSDPMQSGRGRPSKGGQAVRAQRYYAKNHMLVLQKRRLKRYTTKVKHHLQEYDYESLKILTALEEALKTRKKGGVKKLEENELLVQVDLGRDDRYLDFMNDEGQAFIDNLYKDERDSYPSEERIAEVSAELRESHSLLMFKLCTLLSAYLLMHYVENLKYDTEEEGILQQKHMQKCDEIYVTTYKHLMDEDEDDEQHNERAAAAVKVEQVEEDLSKQLEENDSEEASSEEEEEDNVNNEDNNDDEYEDEDEKADEKRLNGDEEEEEEEEDGAVPKKRKLSLKTFLS